MKRRRPLPSKLLALFLAACLLSGCWDRKEVEDIGFVLAMGLDKRSDGQIAVTVQIAVPRVLGGGGQGSAAGAGSAPPVLVERVIEPSVAEALRDLETFTSRRVSFTQLKVVIIARQLAEEGVAPYVSILQRNREMRNTMLLIVADNTAEEILTTQPALERDPASYLEDLARRAHERTARAPRVSLHHFMSSYETLAQQATLPIARTRTAGPGLENRAIRKGQLSGTAVFVDDRMVGELSPDETEILLLLTKRMGSFMESIPMPGKPERILVVEMTDEQLTVKVDPSGRVPVIDVHVSTEAELREAFGAPPDLITPEGLRRIERVITGDLERRAAVLVSRMQEQAKSDIFGFGQSAKIKFPDWPSWTQYNWPKRFPEAQVKVTVATNLRRVGMTFQPPTGGKTGSGTEEQGQGR